MNPWLLAEENELLRWVRALTPRPLPDWFVIRHANFVTAYHLSLDFNQPALTRQLYREEALRLAQEIRYSRA